MNTTTTREAADEPNAIAAATHAVPYPFYARWAREQPLVFDARINMWVAASAAAVRAALTHPHCRVRPSAEPVPSALLGSAAGDIFRRLVRMTDGAGHCPLKQAVSTTLNNIPPEATTHACSGAARLLSESNESRLDINTFMFALPAYAVGLLLGVPESELPTANAALQTFVRCVSPGSTAEQVEQGTHGAQVLLHLVTDLLNNTDALPPHVLLRRLTEATAQLGVQDAALVAANGIGFLSQAYEATAGLIGNALVALARQPQLQTDLTHLMQHVMRTDPPIQNTRRFVAEDCVLLDTPLRKGDVVLVLLAAANHDATATEGFGFGTGMHQCPGQHLAATIAQTGVAHLLQRGLDPQTLLPSMRYRPSQNARIPLFQTA